MGRLEPPEDSPVVKIGKGSGNKNVFVIEGFDENEGKVHGSLRRRVSSSRGIGSRGSTGRWTMRAS